MEKNLKKIFFGFKEKFQKSGDYKGSIAILLIISGLLVIIYPFPDKEKIIYPLKNLWILFKAPLKFWSRQWFLFFGTFAFIVPWFFLYLLYYGFEEKKRKTRILSFAIPTWLCLSVWFSFLGRGSERGFLKGGYIGDAIVNLFLKYLPDIFLIIFLLIGTLLLLHFVYHIKLPWKMILEKTEKFIDNFFSFLKDSLKNYLKKKKEAIKIKAQENENPQPGLVGEKPSPIDWERLKKEYRMVSDEEFERIKKEAKEKNWKEEEIEGRLEEISMGRKLEDDHNGAKKNLGGEEISIGTKSSGENEIKDEDIDKEIKKLINSLSQGEFRKDVVYKKTLRFLKKSKKPIKKEDICNAFEKALKYLKKQEDEKKRWDNYIRNTLQKTEDILYDVFFLDYDYISGMENLKEKLYLNIEGFIKDRDLITKVGGKSMQPAQGILLYGAPGCGKTFFARATAGEFNQLLNLKVAIVGLGLIKGSHWSVQIKKLEEVFLLIKQNSPCVAIWDEIDAFASDPAKTKRKYDYEKSTFFKQQLDGLEDREKPIIHIATSNYPWLMEGALLRPGRFSIIYVPPPDEKSRREFIEQRVMDMWIEGKIEIDELVLWTEGNTISEIKGYIDKVAENVVMEIKRTKRERGIYWEDFVKEKDMLQKKGYEGWLIEAKNQLKEKDKEGMKELFQDIFNSGV